MLNGSGATSIRYLGQLILAATRLADRPLALHESITVRALQIQRRFYSCVRSSSALIDRALSIAR
jgi:hypothetical protein